MKNPYHMDPDKVDLQGLYFELHRAIYGSNWGMDRTYPQDFEAEKPREYRLFQDVLRALLIESRGYHAPLFSLGMLYRDGGQEQLAESLLICAGLAFRAEGEADSKYEEDECWDAVGSIALERGELLTARLAGHQMQERTLRAEFESKYLATIRQQRAKGE